MQNGTLKLLGGLAEPYVFDSRTTLGLVHKQIIGLLFACWLERTKLGSKRAFPTREELDKLLGSSRTSFDVRCTEATRPLRSTAIGALDSTGHTRAVLPKVIRNGPLICDFTYANWIDAVQLLNASETGDQSACERALESYHGHFDKLFKDVVSDERTVNRLVSWIRLAKFQLWLAYLKVARNLWTKAERSEQVAIYMKCQELSAENSQSLELSEAEEVAELLNCMHPTRHGGAGVADQDPKIQLEIARTDLLQGRPHSVSLMLAELPDGVRYGSGPITCEYLLLAGTMLERQGGHQSAIEAFRRALSISEENQIDPYQTYCHLSLIGSEIKLAEHQINLTQYDEAKKLLESCRLNLEQDGMHLSTEVEVLRHRTLCLQLVYLAARADRVTVNWEESAAGVDELQNLVAIFLANPARKVSLEDRYWLSTAHNTIGNVAYFAGEWAVARKNYSAALKEFRAMSAPRQLGAAAINVACCAIRLNAPNSVARNLKTAIKCFAFTKLPAEIQIEELSWIPLEYAAIGQQGLANRLRERIELIRGSISPDLLAAKLSDEIILKSKRD